MSQGSNFNCYLWGFLFFESFLKPPCSLPGCHFCLKGRILKQNDSEQSILVLLLRRAEREGLGQTGVEVSRVWAMAWTKEQWLQVRDVKT